MCILYKSVFFIAYGCIITYINKEVKEEALPYFFHFVRVRHSSTFLGVFATVDIPRVLWLSNYNTGQQKKI